MQVSATTDTLRQPSCNSHVSEKCKSCFQQFGQTSSCCNSHVSEKCKDSKAKVNINQGIDIRIMTDEKAEMIKKLRVDIVHFAWDRYEEKDMIVPKFKMFKEITGWGHWKTGVFVLTNYDTTLEQDLERIYTLRDLDYDPYVMIYDKEHTKSTDICRRLQRYVNNRKIFKTIKTFDEYLLTL